MKLFQGGKFAFNVALPNNSGKSRVLSLCRTPFLVILFLIIATENTLAGKKDSPLQVNSSPFGPVSDFPVEGDPLDIAVVRHRQRNMIAVLTHSATDVDFYVIDRGGAFAKSSSFHLSHPMANCFPCDVNNDGREDLIFQTPSGNKCIILVRSGNTWREYVVPLPETARKLILADVNNDHRQDILAFGKSTTGLTVMYGKAEMKFKEPVLLLPDISISDLAVKDLNGDEIADLVLLNWLTEELMLFYGIGRGVFSEQITAKLQGEPVLLALTQKERERTFQIAVTLPVSREIVILGGNAAGEFVTHQRFDLQRSPRGVRFIDANGDDLKDLVLSTDHELIFSGANTRSSFEKPVSYGIGSLSGWGVADMDGDGDHDLVAGDASNSRLVVIASTVKPNDTWPDQYSAGIEPLGLLARDVTNDGFMDICVANAQSSTVSIFVNKGNGRFHAQKPLMVSEFCNALRIANSTENGIFFLVTSHARKNHVAVTRLLPDLTSDTTINVPTGQQPYLVSTTARPDNRLEVLVRSREPGLSTLTMSLFEEYQEGKFIEKSLRANAPKRVLAMTSADLRTAHQHDLVVMSREELTDTVSVMIGFAKNQFDFPLLTRVVSFIDSTGSSFMLLTGKVNEDAWADIMVFAGAPERKMGVIYALDQEQYADTISWIAGVQALNEDCVILDDVNADARTDITYVDPERQTLMVLFQRPGGGFRSPVAIESASGVRGIQIASLKKNGIRDLVMSHSDKGKISIVFDPFRNR